MSLPLAPEGVKAPVISKINETALRISWFAPETPNGEVTGYNIYVDNDVIPTQLTIPSSYVLADLKPFTVYAIQVSREIVIHVLVLFPTSIYDGHSMVYQCLFV